MENNNSDHDAVLVEAHPVGSPAQSVVTLEGLGQQIVALQRAIEENDEELSSLKREMRTRIMENRSLREQFDENRSELRTHILENRSLREQLCCALTGLQLLLDAGSQNRQDTARIRAWIQGLSVSDEHNASAANIEDSGTEGDAPRPPEVPSFTTNCELVENIREDVERINGNIKLSTRPNDAGYKVGDKVRVPPGKYNVVCADSQRVIGKTDYPETEGLVMGHTKKSVWVILEPICATSPLLRKMNKSVVRRTYSV